MLEDQQPRIEPPADGAGVITYELDVVSGELKWNDALYAVLGYDQSEPANTLEWWAHHVHPGDAMAVNEMMDMMMYPWVKEWTVDYRFEKADKSYAQVHDRAMITRDQDGKAVRLTGTIWQ
jgi:PAS domain-containing protein